MAEKSQHEELVALLQKNNELLEKIFKLQRKEHRAQTWRTVLHVVMSLLPFIIAIIFVYYLFTLVNNNIQALKGNIDALKDFIINIVPDFSGVGEQLNSVWQDITFWD